MVESVWRCPMAAIKLNISLDENAARTLRRRAAEVGKPASRYLADLIEEDAKRSQDELAAEGYRALSADTAGFAAQVWAIAAEWWPAWDEEAAPRTPAGGARQANHEADNSPP